MDSPSGRVPERAPERFLVAIEACGDRTTDLGFCLEVWVFIEGFGVENKSGGPTGCPRGTGARPRGWARPPPSWAPRDSSPITFSSSIIYIFQKKSPLIFSAFRELLFLYKNNTTVVLLKTASVRVSSNQIIPKACRNIINMA